MPTGHIRSPGCQCALCSKLLQLSDTALTKGERPFISALGSDMSLAGRLARAGGSGLTAASGR